MPGSWPVLFPGYISIISYASVLADCLIASVRRAQGYLLVYLFLEPLCVGEGRRPWFVSRRTNRVYLVILSTRGLERRREEQGCRGAL